MWRGLFTAATGMITEQKRTDVISNNLANAATTGFKKDVAVHKEFENMLIRRVYDHEDGGTVGLTVDGFNSLGNLGTSSNDVTQFKGFNADPFYRPSIGTLGLGDYIDEIAVDHEQGAFESTGNTFDLAISGQGFFTIQTPNNAGVLQDIRGYNLLDTNNQPITIPRDVPAERIVVTPDGGIFVNADRNQQQRQIAQIQFVQFDNRLAVEKQGDNLFYAVTDNEGNVAQPQPATGEIFQGCLEKSNTSIVEEMVELIHNHRMYDANSKAVTTQDTMLEASVTEVGRLGG